MIKACSNFLEGPYLEANNAEHGLRALNPLETCFFLPLRLQVGNSNIRVTNPESGFEVSVQLFQRTWGSHWALRFPQSFLLDGHPKNDHRSGLRQDLANFLVGGPISRHACSPHNWTSTKPMELAPPWEIPLRFLPCARCGALGVHPTFCGAARAAHRRVYIL